MNIEVQNLSMTYPTGKRALQDLSFEMQSPNLIGLLGPNGAGKIHLNEITGGGAIAHHRRDPVGRGTADQK